MARTTFIEFKGAAEHDWTRKQFTNSFGDEAAKNAIAMWNSFLLYDYSNEGRIFFGIHDDRTMHGITVPLNGNDNVSKIQDTLRQAALSTFTNQMQSNRVTIYPATKSFEDLTACFSVDAIPLRYTSNNIDAVYFLVSVVVKRPSFRVVMEFDFKILKRAPTNCRAEVKDATPKEIQMLLNSAEH